MSFILDALKKSDKKRQETNAPRLDTVHDFPPQKSSRRPLWIALLVGVLLLNVGLLLWFFTFGQQAPVGTANIVQQQPVIESAAPKPVTTPQPQPQVQAVKPPLPQVSSPKQSSSMSTFEPSRPPVVDRVYALSELPGTIQRRIPDLHMSLHVYNKKNATAGMVRVNEQILRQGDTLDGKFLLEEITADGAVFHFEGYQFLLSRH